jgi:rubrerythrin
MSKDLIDRQAAIDALADYIHNIDKVYSTGKLSADDCKDAAKSVLDDLPSAHPYTDEEVQKIQDLEQAQLDKAYELGRQSAQPMRKKGKWIWKGEQGDSRFMCSVCHWKENVPTCNGKPTIWQYCPSCGAKMEGGEDDS